MYRYLALAWNPEDLKATVDADGIRSRLTVSWPDVREAVHEEGFAAFIPSSGHDAWQTLVRRGHGIIFGRLFRGGREAESGIPGPQEWERIGATQGKSLLE